MITALIKKKSIRPKFNGSNTYELTKEYKEAFLELTAMETQIDLNIDIGNEEEREEKTQLIKNSEIREKIRKIRNVLPRKSLDDAKRKLAEIDVEGEDDDEEEE